MNGKGATQYKDGIFVADPWERKQKKELKVWEKKASIYDRFVTKTRNPLLRLYISKEQELLDKFLKKMIAKNPGKKITIFEIGSGTGRMLLRYITKPDLIDKCEYLIGIDEATAMYNISIFKINELAPKISKSSLSDKFVFLNLRAENLSRYFNRGRILMKKLNEDDVNGCLRKIDPKKYDESIKVVINLLNTLGVIKETKQLVARNMVKITGSNGRIVISVFNGTSFSKHASNIYHSIRNIVGKFDEKSFLYHEMDFVTDSYYSHWFTNKELKNSMKNAGCINIRVKPIQEIALFAMGEVKK